MLSGGSFRTCCSSPVPTSTPTSGNTIPDTLIATMAYSPPLCAPNGAERTTNSAGRETGAVEVCFHFYSLSSSNQPKTDPARAVVFVILVVIFINMYTQRMRNRAIRQASKITAEKLRKTNPKKQNFQKPHDSTYQNPNPKTGRPTSSFWYGFMNIAH